MAVVSMKQMSLLERPLAFRNVGTLVACSLLGSEGLAVAESLFVKKNLCYINHLMPQFNQ
jgi:hypothetical protein